MHLGTRLALIASGHLALHSDDGWVKAETIAKEYNMPELYLVKIMQHMAKANVLKSKRGPRGGFMLGRPAEEISILEIIESAEGPVAYRTDLTDIRANDIFGPGLEEAMKRASDKAISVLSRATLGQMAGT